MTACSECGFSTVRDGDLVDGRCADTSGCSRRLGMLAGGAKYDDGKTPLDLWSPDVQESVAQVLAFGASKYQPYNWAKGISYRRVFAALLRHLWAWWRGRDMDDETGMHHLAHAGCCLMFLLHYEINRERYMEFDDRFDYDGAA